MSSFRYRKIKTRRAFTLIEMALATALAASIMVAVLGVLARFSRSREGRVAGASNEAIEEAVVSVIETDLLNAETLEPLRDGVTIKGFGCIDADTKCISHFPAEIVYQVRPAGTSTWLIRRQTRTGPTGQVRTQSELVCRGVTKFALVPIGEPAKEQAPERGQKQSLPAPAGAKLTITFGDAPAKSKQRSVERVLYLR